ncbi:hypothetical protein GCM10008019_27280 [Deinococcus soli (ex Cha et al. 2016)]|nr:hypothetical protein GCM10008019_27280 [Deinococcus soli (ex Cha et al. 2016)]
MVRLAPRDPPDLPVRTPPCPGRRASRASGVRSAPRDQPDPQAHRVRLVPPGRTPRCPDLLVPLVRLDLLDPRAFKDLPDPQALRVPLVRREPRRPAR